jgi:hypothetical protein
VFRRRKRQPSMSGSAISTFKSGNKLKDLKPMESFGPGSYSWGIQTKGSQ